MHSKLQYVVLWLHRLSLCSCSYLNTKFLAAAAGAALAHRRFTREESLALKIWNVSMFRNGSAGRKGKKTLRKGMCHCWSRASGSEMYLTLFMVMESNSAPPKFI
jgi:hypothetical protein